MNPIDDPYAALQLLSAIARIPGRPQAAIRRAELRFRGRNYRFVELRFLSGAGDVVLALRLSREQWWRCAGGLLDESTGPFPE